MNISAGTGVPVFATTVTRDAAFGGAGEKVLAEGQLCYLSSTNVVQYYDGAAWQPVGAASGLTLVKSQTVGSAVASVEVTGAFSATYDAYKIILTGGTCSANNSGLTMVLGASTTTYSGAFIYYGNTQSTASSGTPSALSIGTSLWQCVGTGSTSSNSICMEIQNPFLASFTYYQANNFDPVNSLIKQGFGIHSSNTSYSAFTIAAATGTMTGGTIRVYGYANS
jgi:hypothetical protein